MPSDPVLWRFADCDALRASLAEACDGWITSAERRDWEAIGDTRRREQWLWGRWLAKQLLRDSNAFAGADAHSIEIFTPRDQQNRSLRPVVSFRGKEQHCSLSLSHTERAALAAVSVDRGVSVGVDAVLIGAPCERSFDGGFLTTWFTSREQRRLASAGPRDIATVWAVKEAVYKALHQGEPFAPRRIEVDMQVAGPPVCRYGELDLRDACRARVEQAADHVLAVVAVIRDRLIEVSTGHIVPSPNVVRSP